MYFLMEKANKYRVVNMGDLSAQGALPIGAKREPSTEDKHDTASDFSMPGLEPKRGTTVSTPSSTPPPTAPKGDQASAPTSGDWNKLTDFERSFFDGMVIFLNEHGRDEAAPTTAIRFQFTRSLMESVPHHQRKLGTWIEGNVHQLITLVTIDIERNGRSLYRAVAAISTVKFNGGKTVDEVINELNRLQLEANRIKPQAIDDEVVKGCLLSLCSNHSQFKDLARDFSRTDCKLSLDQMIVELRQHQAFINTQQRTQISSANLTETKANEPELQTLVAMLGEYLKKGGRARKFGQDDTNTNEVCRNFLRGKCRNPSCHRLHPLGKEGSKTNNERRVQRRPRENDECYRCGKKGHFARDCTNPPKQQANQAETKESDDEVSVEAFLQTLQERTPQANAASSLKTTEHRVHFANMMATINACATLVPRFDDCSSECPGLEDSDSSKDDDSETESDEEWPLEPDASTKTSAEPEPPAENDEDSDCPSDCPIDSDIEGSDDKTAARNAVKPGPPAENFVPPDASPLPLGKGANQQGIRRDEVQAANMLRCAADRQAAFNVESQVAGRSVMLLDSGASQTYMHGESAHMSKTRTIRKDPDSSVASADASSAPMKSLGRMDAEAELESGHHITLPDAMLLNKGQLRQQL